MEHATLLLNADYSPMKILSWQRAVHMWFSEKVEIVEEYDDFELRSMSVTIKCPAVVRLLSYVKRDNKRVKFSRVNVFGRDDFTCFGAGTRVLMAAGEQRPIVDVSVGDRVIDAYGRPQTVVATGRREVLNAVRLKRKRSHVWTVTTPEHPYLSQDGTFVEIQNIKDYVTFPKNVELDTEVTPLEVSSCLEPSKWYRLRDGRIYCTRRPHEHGLQTMLTPSGDLSYFLGLYAAEGSATAAGVVSLSFSREEEHTLVADSAALIPALFSLPVATDLYSTKANVRTSSKLLSQVLNTVCGKGCYNKVVPWRLISQYPREYLMGVFSGDGYIATHLNKVVLSMTSQELILGVQSMLWGLGVVPSLQTTHREGKHQTWALVLQGDNYVKFMQEVYGTTVPARKPLASSETHYLYKVLSLEPVEGRTMVYNLETTGSHSFIADGVAVHNCQYCQGQPGTPDLTYDHVTPRAQGGQTTWENIVTACIGCNSHKGNRTPEQAAMPLRVQPRRPEERPFHQFTLNIPKTPEAWRSYLYWTQELESDV